MEAVFELSILEHLKHVVKHSEHDQVALHQPAIVQDRPHRIIDFCLVQPIERK